MDQLHINTTAEFNNVIKDAVADHVGVVVLSFKAAWCAPCTMLGTTLSVLPEQFKDRAVFVVSDADEADELVVKFNVRSLPLVVVYDAANNSVYESITGSRSRDYFVNSIEKALVQC